ncbi:HpcH/HpaI aldolase/citrate lyase family protein [uncultured Serinicoccus sp.]|uniref:HpcH/HpaI aldolase family protein n=1 Tax=uncultured Serinicoccus sp. TaxID=735514 RepID=UPI00262BDFD5|nr:aldolase/citrate lyase family protein [uncultured Serinicoccus sp.]
MYSNPFFAQWAQDSQMTGAWCTLPDTVAAEVLGRQGFDYVCVDQQHGLIDDSTMVPMLQAIDASGAAPLVRVRWNEPPAIMSALDAGAAGVVVPMIETAEDAARAVSACRFPPQGQRSYGPIRAREVMGSGETEVVQQVACIVMIETAAAMENLDDILDTPGLDGVYIGPNDLTLALGGRPNTTTPEFVAAVDTIQQACRSRGLAIGMHTGSGGDAQHYLSLGFDFVTVVSDAGLLARAAAAELKLALRPATDAPSSAAAPSQTY